MSRGQEESSSTTSDSTTTPPPPPLFQPSIYQYTCLGAFHASSSSPPGSVGGATNGGGGRGGSCKGLRSRLELLGDFEISSREKALQLFDVQRGFEDDHGSAQEETAGGEDFPVEPRTRELLVSQSLVFKEPNKQPSNGHFSSSKGTLTDQDYIKHQEWSCYGSTQVSCLVLKNIHTGHEKVAAIVPRNSGLSVRTILTEDNSITNISIGVLNILIDSDAREIPNDKDAQQQQRSSSEDDNLATPEEVPPRPRQDTVAEAKEWTLRTTAFAGKILQHMQGNASFLYQNIRHEDFVARTYASGERIAHQLPPTVLRTTKFMGKLLRMAFGNDPEDGDTEE